MALADIARIVHPAAGGRYRIIGGHMVTALVARWQLGAELYRETANTDVGIPEVVARDLEIVESLARLKYAKVAGDRFARPVQDVPVSAPGAPDPEAVIDLLIPARTSRARRNRAVGPSLVAIEVLGLATALRRPPVTLELDMCRLNGERALVELNFPDEVSALTLKGFATRERDKPTDLVDLWRCLEVANAAGLGPGDFAEGDPASAGEHIRALFAKRHGKAMAAFAEEKRLAPGAADQHHTRIVALIARVLGL